MSNITIDFETAYDTAAKYSLRNLTVIEYVRDPRFQSFGASVKVGDQPSQWMNHAQLVDYFSTVDWSTTHMIGHNLMFDAFVLAFHYGHVAAHYIDTLKMARYCLGQSIKSHSLGTVYQAVTGLQGKQKVGALDELDGVFRPTPDQMQRLGEYAQDDADEAYAIFAALYPQFPAVEYPRMSWCVRMFVSPMLMLDPLKLEEVHEFEKKEKQELLDLVGYDIKQIRSNDQFAEILTQAGLASLPMKKSPSTGKDTYAFSKTDKEFQDLLDHDDRTIHDLVRCRLRVKTSIEETRAKRLADVHRRMGGWLPVPLNYCGAMPTNRLSGGEKLNLQNLGRGSKLRDAIVAPPGYKICAADLSNIELRIAMCVAKEISKVALLATGADLYCDFASTLYGRTVEKPDSRVHAPPIFKQHKDDRLVGKVSCLSLNYQSGADTYRQMLYVMGNGMWVPRQFAQSTVSLYRQMNPSLTNMWALLQQYLACMEEGKGMVNPTGAPLEFTADGIVLPSGFKIKYPKVGSAMKKNAWGKLQKQYHYRRYSRDNPSGKDYLYGGKILENICQALAREVLADIQDRVFAHLNILPALQVHDELVYVIHESMGDWFKEFIEMEMGRPLSWWPDLPLAAEAEIGDSYGDAK